MKNMDKNAAEGNSVSSDVNKVGVGLGLGTGGGKMGSSQLPGGGGGSGMGGSNGSGGAGTNNSGASGVGSAAGGAVHDPASLLDAASLFGELLAFTDRKISFFHYRSFRILFVNIYIFHSIIQ